MRILLQAISFMLLAAATAKAQDSTKADIVTWATTNVADVCVSCPEAKVRLAVSPVKPELKADDVKLSVVEVALGNQKSNELQSAFSPSWEKDNDGRPTAIVLKVVTPSTLAKSGTYDMLLALRPATGTPARLKLQIIHPAAKLRALDTLIVSRIYTFGWHVDKLPLTLSETSGRSNLTGIQIRPIRGATGPEGQVTGHLEFPHQTSTAGNGKSSVAMPKPIDVEAGKSAEVPYNLAGEFPLGKASGSLEATAPELADTVPFNFEVRSRLARWYIFLFIVPGLLIGWFLKVELQHNIEMGEARLRATVLLDQIQADFNNRKDAQFRSGIETALIELERAIKVEDPKELDTKKQALDQAWRTALQSLAVKRQAAQASIDALVAVTNSSWPVPNPVDTAITNAKASLTAILQLMASDDVGTADKKRQTAQEALGISLDKAAKDWQRDIEDYLLNGLANADKGISSVLKTGFQKLVTDTLQSIGKARLSAIPTASDMMQFLHDLSAELRIARDTLIRLARNISAEFNNANTILSTRVEHLDPAAVQNLRSKVATLTTSLEQAAKDPTKALTELPNELLNLHAAWTAALLNELLATSQKPVKDLLNQEAYLEATQKLDEILSGRQALGGGPTPSAWQDLPPTPELAPGLLVSIRSLSHQDAMPAPLPAFVARTKGQVVWNKFLQSLLVGVLLGLIGYSIYAEKFVGNFSDFILIFFWAFGLDLTVDTVVKSLPKKPA